MSNSILFLLSIPCSLFRRIVSIPNLSTMQTNEKKNACSLFLILKKLCHARTAVAQAAPPPSPYSQPFSTFHNQFSSFLSHAVTTPHEFIITGDFNIHVDYLGDTQTIQFFDHLANCNLTQNVKISTHRHGHTLDLIITSANTTLNPVITSSHIVASDHYPIFTSINVHPKPPPPPTTFTYRRINAIDYPKFIDNINSSPLITNPPSCLPDLLDLFFATLRSLLDHHAPSSPKPINPLALLPLLGSLLKSSVLNLPAAVWNAPTSHHTLFDLKLLRSSTKPLP